ncbi:nucleotide disphospho-sugar-binding domain-containing protein [Actinophytocola sp.]|uniref:nucleotide disphospho-sugar-binding domain-containing protein n=1 Tax=Actinophytocola sp. TaxID=1872138 RepID=UPI002D7E6BE3|nr:nucleotide disphospho-sugar-binding domain-containing protein [Actinophytocola sp.]HET9140753.1 nucleotide disphospho-sugar-binding domain-containing protein [Actinophytocola sp.]
MRVLFATVPHPSHSLQLVPYAQALQNAGHEVRVALAPLGVSDMTEAGLTAVTFGDTIQHSVQNFAELSWIPNEAERAAYVEALRLDPFEADQWDVFYQYFNFNCQMYLPEEPRPDVDGMIEFARDWKPDLVLWESWFPIGALVARACGAAHARILLGPDLSGWASEIFAERNSPAVEALGGNPLVKRLRQVADRYGITVDDELMRADLTIDPLPPEIRLSRNISTLPVRGIPYQRGGVLPEFLHKPPTRPRVAVSFGMSVRLWQFGGDTRVPPVMEAVDGLDIEVVATLNENQLASTPRVPDNVRIIEFLPLTQLLPTCDLLINHGAAGTFRAAEAAGIPQIIIDTQEPHRIVFSGEGENVTVSNADRHTDSWLGAKLLADRGVGVTINHLEQSAAEIREQIQKLLTDESYKDNARAMQRAWMAKPGPADIIPNLVELAERHRSGS